VRHARFYNSRAWAVVDLQVTKNKQVKYFRRANQNKKVNGYDTVLLQT